MSAERIAAVVRNHRFRYENEEQLQRAIAAVLEGAGFAHEREVWLTDRDRIDFLVGDVGVEIKVKGSVSAVQAQLFRYAESERVAGLVLVTDRGQLVGGLRGFTSILDKPVQVVRLYGGLR